MKLYEIFVNGATDVSISFGILFEALPWSSCYSLPCTFIVPCYFQPPAFTQSVYVSYASVPIMCVVISSTVLFTLSYTCTHSLSLSVCVLSFSPSLTHMYIFLSVFIQLKVIKFSCLPLLCFCPSHTMCISFCWFN